MRSIVIDVLSAVHHPPVVAQRVASVGIDVKPRIIAAGDVDPDTVSFLENVRGRVERDCDRDNVVRV